MRGGTRGLLARLCLILLASALLTSIAPPVGAQWVAHDPSYLTPDRVAPAVTATDDWTAFLHGSLHESNQAVPEGLSPSTVANLSLLWSFPTGGNVVTEPAVENDGVFFGSWDGFEYALNATNGSLRWKTALGESACQPRLPAQGITSSATALNDTLYLGGGADYWYALSERTGAILWKVYTGNSSTGVGGGHYNWGSPLVVGGRAYIGISSHCDHPLVVGQLLQVDLASHAVIRTFNTTTVHSLGATIWASPAYDPSTGLLFAATGNLKVGAGTNSTLDDSILAFSPTTLRLVNRFQVPYGLRLPDGDFGASPTLYRNSQGVPMVADTNKDGYLYALDERNLGAGPVWTYPLSTGLSFSTAAFDDGTLYVGSGSTVNASGVPLNGSVRAINATTGKLLWMIPMPGNVFGPISVSEGILVASGGTEMVVARESDGAVLFHFNASRIFQGGATIAGGRIFVGNNNGRLYAFGLPLRATLSDSVSATNRLKVNFVAHLTGGAGGFRVLWSFGDGGTALGTRVSHTYATAGNYSVGVVVTDHGWNNVTAQQAVVVSAPRRVEEAPGECIGMAQPSRTPTSSPAASRR